MPQPTKGDVHVNQPLTNISVAYIQKSEAFFASKVFPFVPVQKQSDRYFKYTKEYWFTDEMKLRAPGSESAGSGFSVDNTPTYFADVWALHKDIDDQTRQNADAIDMDRDATLYLSQKALIRMDRLFVSEFFTTGKWLGSSTGTDIVITTKWNATSSTPVADVDKEKLAIKQKTGQVANVLVLAPLVYTALKSNGDILDRIKYTQRGVITPELLAGIFDVEKVVVADSVYNAAAEGATANMQFIAGAEGALLCFANPSPSIMTPSGGYIFGWTGLMGAGATGTRIKTFRKEEIESDRVEIQMAFDMNLVAADCGAFFSDVLT